MIHNISSFTGILNLIKTNPRSSHAKANLNFKTFCLVVVAILAFNLAACAQDFINVAGTWKVMDDPTSNRNNIGTILHITQSKDGKILSLSGNYCYRDLASIGPNSDPEDHSYEKKSRENWVCSDYSTGDYVWDTLFDCRQWGGGHGNQAWSERHQVVGDIDFEAYDENEAYIELGYYFDQSPFLAISNYCFFLERVTWEPLLTANPNLKSVTAEPEILLIDENGNPSGIQIKAITREPCEVAFKIISPEGSIFELGSKMSGGALGACVADISWLGSPNLATGSYQVVAKASSTGEQAAALFYVERAVVGQPTLYLVGLDTLPGGNSKDPTDDAAPSEPEPVTCPPPQGQLSSRIPGNPGGISVSDPVNIVSGNFFLSETDLTLKSRLPLSLIRNYNSIDQSISMFGRGWSSPFSAGLQINPSHVIFTNSDGSKILFKASDSAFISPEGHDIKLVHSSDTSLWSVSTSQGSEWFFDENGKIIRMVKACCGAGASDAIDFEYDSDGYLAKVSNSAGQWLQFLTTDGLTTTVTDSSGRTLSCEYDANRYLTKVTNAMGHSINYLYDENGFMTQITRPGNKTTSIQYSDGKVTQITNPDSTVNTFAWDTSARKTTLTDANGISYVYSFDQDWRLTSFSVPSVALNKALSFTGSAVSSHTNSLGENTSYQYNADGYLSSITDKTGFVTNYEWHPTLHRLTSKTDALGRVWTYAWCQRGNLINETDPAGNITRYGYDSHNNRTFVTDSLGRVTRYVYDATGNSLLQSIDAMGGVSSYTYDLRGNLTSSTDQLGRASSYEYDLLDRLTRSTYADARFTQISYDEAGNIASRIDNLNRTTAYTYDADGKLLTTTRPDGTVLSHAYDASGRKTSSTDALGLVTSYEYDALDNMVKVIYPDQSFQSYAYNTEKRLVSSTDELGNVTAYEYDPMGRMLATIDPTGSRWESQYDAAGRKIAAKDPLGRITANEYDVLDRVVKTTAPDLTTNTNNFDALGNLLVSTNALNQQTTFQYDALNRQIKTVRANGAQFTTTYDAAGQVISETDALGNTTTNAYDVAGRRVATTNALNHVWHYNYDNAGRLVNTIDPMSGTATMSYDVMDRAVSESDALGRTTSYEYDAAGKRIAKTDAIGRRSIFAYDSRDRLTTEVDGAGRIVTHAFDAAGRKLSLTDGAGRIWRWVYDSLGRVTAEIDPLGNETKSAYNAVGGLILKTNARAQATSYEFNVMNQLAKINYPDTSVATFSYDALGRELIRSSSTGSVAKKYDIAGNLISENFGNFSKIWQYSYDLMGNRIKAISPENATFKYTYDKLYRLVELDSGNAAEKINYAYDALGRTITEKRTDLTTANSFDAAGQLLKMKHYKLIKVNNSYGCGKNKRQPQEPTYKEEITALRQYVYDLAGNRISMLDEAGKATSYSYDNSNWLVQVTYPGNDVVTYTYNDAGDRLSEQLNNKPAVAYAYDAAGRMSVKGNETFNYDADGNMLTDAVASYTWNSDNRLMRVEKTFDDCKHDKGRCGNGFGHLMHGKKTVAYEEYSYLPEDWRRITRKTGEYKPQQHNKCILRSAEKEETFVSIYDGDDESHEYLLSLPANKFFGKCKAKPSLKLIREFVNGPGTDDIEYTRTGKISLAMLKDGLGSTIALTGREGKTIAKIGYDAWGEFRWSDKNCKSPCNNDDFDGYIDRFENIRGFGNAEHNSHAFGRQFASRLTPYLYTGRRYSELTSQYFNRQRYYSPALGRFTSKDPIGFLGGDNLWRYADNNPALYIDPWGLLSEEECKALKREILSQLNNVVRLNNMYEHFKLGEDWSTYGCDDLSTAIGFRSEAFKKMPPIAQKIANEKIYSLGMGVLSSVLWATNDAFMGSTAKFTLNTPFMLTHWRSWIGVEKLRTLTFINHLQNAYKTECEETCKEK